MGEPVAKRCKTDNETNGDSSKTVGDYDAATQKILEQIDQVQSEIDSLNEKASEEILKVEQKYNSLRKPFFDKRNDLVRDIPNFWVTAMESLNNVPALGRKQLFRSPCNPEKFLFVNHPNISAILDEEEEECLHYLTTVELIKEFFLGDFEPTSTTTVIKWKPDNDLLNKVKTKSQNSGDATPAPRSFFAWLSDNQDPSNDEIAERFVVVNQGRPLAESAAVFLVPEMDENAGVSGDDDNFDDIFEEADDAGEDNED
ncbi:Protein SET [Dirofilaria immitis]|nr:Protein SET [Dirofilaria immitis]